MTIVCQWGIALTDNLIFFFLGRKINDVIIINIGNTIYYLTIRRFNKAEVVNLCIDTKRRNQTDVWTFRGLDWTQTAIVSVVYVTNLETRTFTRKTTGTKG